MKAFSPIALAVCAVLAALIAQAKASDVLCITIGPIPPGTVSVCQDPAP